MLKRKGLCQKTFAFFFLLFSLFQSFEPAKGGHFPYFTEPASPNYFLSGSPYWYLYRLRALAAQDYACGQGVWVVLPDTGVDLEHPQLRGHLLLGLARNFGDPETPYEVQDRVGHGTAMAGLILKVAPCALIIPLKISPGAADFFEKEALKEALSYTLSLISTYPQVRILALSLVEEEDEETAALLREIHGRGVLITAAAGNEASEVAFPARIFETLAVGALTEEGLPWRRNNTGPALTLLAPGTHILAPYLAGGEVYLSGTSAANALVAGSLALLSELSPPRALWALLQASQDLAPPGYDASSGFGVPDLEQAAVSAEINGFLAFPSKLLLRPEETGTVSFFPTTLKLAGVEGPLKARVKRPGQLEILGLSTGSGWVKLCEAHRRCLKVTVSVAREATLLELLNYLSPSGDYYTIYDLQGLLPFVGKLQFWLTYWAEGGFRREMLLEEEFRCRWRICGGLLLELPRAQIPPGIYALELYSPENHNPRTFFLHY